MNQIVDSKGLAVSKAGFTLVEMLIVLALMSMLIVLSVPFVTSLRSDISIQRTLRQVKVDMVSAISYSLAGKSFAALSADDLMNPDLIPAAYALYFKTDADYGNQTPYRYLELEADEKHQDHPMTASYGNDRDYPVASVFLKEITLKKLTTGTATQVDSAYIVIVPPFGKLLFVNENENFLLHLTENDLYQNQHEFDEIELHFWYKDDETSKTIMSLNKNKVINIQ